MSRRRKRHGPEQFIRKLRDADALLAAGRSIGEVCQALQVSEATFRRCPATEPSGLPRGGRVCAHLSAGLASAR